MKNADIIDLAKCRKLKTKKLSDVVKQIEREQQAPVVDMTERRQEIIKNERREVKRTLLTGFIGAFAVVPGHGLLKVSMYDLSDSGLAFDVEGDNGRFHIGEEVAMRIYMNQDTYFPFVAQVQNVRDIDDEGVTRHGAKFSDETLADKAMHHFVKFIENVSASLERDTGDVLVSNK